MPFLAGSHATLTRCVLVCQSAYSDTAWWSPIRTGMNAVWPLPASFWSVTAPPSSGCVLFEKGVAHSIVATRRKTRAAGVLASRCAKGTWNDRRNVETSFSLGHRHVWSHADVSATGALHPGPFGLGGRSVHCADDLVSSTPS